MFVREREREIDWFTQCPFLKLKQDFKKGHCDTIIGSQDLYVHENKLTYIFMKVLWAGKKRHCVIFARW